MPQPSSALFPDNNYAAFLDQLKQRIRTAQIKAALAVNRELILLYWQIGKEILERQETQGWGSKILQRRLRILNRNFRQSKDLVNHIRDFLLELGLGFAFMGRQYPITVDDKEYRIDLLFYHTQLRCYVVIDLKMGEFEPEFAGKMNFYVLAVDDMMRRGDDQSTIGLVLCKTKRKTTAEYALRNLNTPIAVSTHRLPTALKEQLPSVERLEMELERALQEIETQSLGPSNS